MDQSNGRWCLDGFEFRCDDGSPLRVISAMDCCDRKAMTWAAIHAWAGHTSFVPKASPDDDDTPPDDPRGPNDSWPRQNRSKEAHQSTTDEQARLFCKSKGTGAMLWYMGHVLTDSRRRLVVDGQALATGTAGRDAAELTLANAASVALLGITVGADKNNGLLNLSRRTLPLNRLR